MNRVTTSNTWFDLLPRIGNGPMSHVSYEPHVERPRLRPFLAAIPDEREPHSWLLTDRLGISAKTLRVTEAELNWMQLLDGRRSLRDVQIEAMRQAGGELLTLERITAFVAKLETALLLDGPHFQARVHSPVREPSCIGCYPNEPGALRRQLEKLFTGSNGPGLPGRLRDARLRAALVPHIDYTRGGHTYAWGFKELFEHTDASLFVIIGTSHYSAERFTLTRQHFKTPLGVSETDQGYIDRLVKHYGDGLFDDSAAHLPEHSIELEVVFLQYLYENKRSFRIVPLVVGTFEDSVLTGSTPSLRDDVGHMIEALKQAEAETPERICYVISGDLAHLGPKFGDREPVRPRQIEHCKRQDHILMQHAEAADTLSFFRTIADENDARRICGFPPTYTLLEAIRPRHGKRLHYDQYVHTRGFESVSFASMAFYE
jgi:AmmeMemoRadiSam system protein B